MVENVPSLEAKILSLKADTMLVLSHLSKGSSNSEIIAWGRGWNFTDSKISAALKETYAAFGLDSIEYTEEQRRQKAATYYQMWKDHFLARRIVAAEPLTEPGAPISAPQQGDREMDSQESLTDAIPMTSAVTMPSKPRIDLVRLAKGIPDLTSRQKELVECLHHNPSDDNVIAKQLGISKYSIQPMFSVICKRLGIGSLMSLKIARLYIAAALHYADGNTGKAIELQQQAQVLDQSQSREVLQVASQATSVILEAIPENPEITETTVEQEMVPIAHDRLEARIASLSPRLRQLAETIALGIKGEEVAKRLGISLATLHVSKVRLWKLLELPRNSGNKSRDQLLTQVMKNLDAKAKSVGAQIDSPKAEQEVVMPAVIPEIVVKAAPVVKSDGVTSQSRSEVNESHSEAKYVTEPEIAKPNGRDKQPGVAQYGPGIPVTIADPATVTDIQVVSGEHQSAQFAAHIARAKHSGLRPEVLVLYPTSDPLRTHAQIVLIKRDPVPK